MRQPPDLPPAVKERLAARLVAAASARGLTVRACVELVPFYAAWRLYVRMDDPDLAGGLDVDWAGGPATVVRDLREGIPAFLDKLERKVAEARASRT